MSNESGLTERELRVYQELREMSEGTLLERNIVFDLYGFLGNECLKISLDERLDYVEERLNAYRTREKRFMLQILRDLLSELGALREELRSKSKDEEGFFDIEKYYEQLNAFHLPREDVDELLDRLEEEHDFIEWDRKAEQWLKEHGI